MPIIRRPGFVQDIGAGNDKIIAVPTNEYWELLGVHITLLTTGTAGTRQVDVQIRDAGDVILTTLRFGETQIASLTKRYSAALGLVTEVHIAGAMLFAQLPTFQLVEAMDIRAFDNADVDVLDTLDLRVNRLVTSEH